MSPRQSRNAINSVSSWNVFNFEGSTAKEPCIPAKNPYFSAKANYVSTPELPHYEYLETQVYNDCL